MRQFDKQVEYALEFPWFASLPRVETRLYLEQYGGDSDVWIGKTLYRLFMFYSTKRIQLLETNLKVI